MTTVFRTRPYGKFIEIQGNLRKKKLNRANQQYSYSWCPIGFRVVLSWFPPKVSIKWRKGLTPRLFLINTVTRFPRNEANRKQA